MNKHQQLDRKVLTLAELCDYLRIHKTTAYRLVKRGKIPGFRIGSYWRFNIEAIEKWRGVLDE
jgi:excisionase family DNA binding protein